MTLVRRALAGVLLLALAGAWSPAAGGEARTHPQAGSRADEPGPTGRSSVVRLDRRRTGTPTTPPAGLRTSSSSAAKDRVRRVVVKWDGRRDRRRYSKTAVVPGIGHLKLVCRPDATMVRLYAEDRSKETQLWMAKYETKNNHAVVAVKTVRIYRYANADDDGTGGTGRYGSEGLNQQTPIENFSSGYLNGVISQRPGRHEAAKGAARTPVTSLKLNWWWTGFRHPMSWRSCKIDAVLTTRFQPRMGVNWHGDADAVENAAESYWLPSIGELTLRCEPDLDGDGGRQHVSLDPIVRNRETSAWVETVSGEGKVEDHVEADSFEHDPETGRLGNFWMPRNGMMRLYFDVGDAKRSFILSSYYVTNNARNPSLNLCETAIAPFR